MSRVKFSTLTEIEELTKDKQYPKSYMEKAIKHDEVDLLGGFSLPSKHVECDYCSNEMFVDGDQVLCDVCGGELREVTE